MIGPAAVRSGPAAIRFGGVPGRTCRGPLRRACRAGGRRGDQLLQDAGRRRPAAPLPTRARSP